MAVTPHLDLAREIKKGETTSPLSMALFNVEVGETSDETQCSPTFIVGSIDLNQSKYRPRGSICQPILNSENAPRILGNVG
jgi:hypothetical protein